MFVLAAAVGPATGGPPAAGAAAPPPVSEGLGLCLELTQPRASVQLGEPVVAAVSLRNCSRQTRQVEDLLAPEYGFLQLTLSVPAGGTRPYRPVARRDARGRRPRSLAPGESLSAWVPLYVDAEGWLLDRAGRYDLHAEYALATTRLACRPVALQVAAPAAASERAAATLMMDGAAARFLLTGQDQAGRGEARLSTLLREHPQSRLAPYARLALALVRTRQRFDAALKIFQAPDRAGAVELLAPAVRRIGDPFLAARGTRTLADCLRALGRAAEAERVIAAYSASHPAALELPGVAEALRGDDKGAP